MIDSETNFETNKLNQSTLLYKISCSFLSKSEENRKCARSMLLLLLEKQTERIKIPLFSIIVKNQIDFLSLSTPFKRTILDFLVNKVSRQRKLH